MYRAVEGEAKPKWHSIAGAVIAGRLLMIAALVWAGVSLLPLLYYLGALFFVISSVQWVASRKAVAK